VRQSCIKDCLHPVHACPALANHARVTLLVDASRICLPQQSADQPAPPPLITPRTVRSATQALGFENVAVALSALVSPSDLIASTGDRRNITQLVC
jgi:hypothetical protein